MYQKISRICKQSRAGGGALPFARPMGRGFAPSALPRLGSGKALQKPCGRGILCASLGLGLLVAFGLSTLWQAQAAFANTCAEIRRDTLRLHVVASSNAVADQAAKLAVRDAMLSVMESLYQEREQAQGGTSPTPPNAKALGGDAQAVSLAPMDANESAALVLRNLPRFALAASEALATNIAHTPSGGAACCPQVRLCLAQEYFDTTQYDTFTLPAGDYTALRVEIGAAKGRNWWCVLSPALCLASASGEYQAAAENEIICGDYALRFAALEWWQKHINA